MLVKVTSVTATTAHLLWSQSMRREWMFLVAFWQTGQPPQSAFVDSNFLVLQHLVPDTTYNAYVTLEDATSSPVTFTTRPLPEAGTLKSIVAGDNDPDDGKETCVAASSIK